MTVEPGRAKQSENSPMIKASGLDVSYGKIAALQDVELEVFDGEVVSVIGPNGAGKSTLLETFAGFHDYQGQLTYGGQEIREYTVSELVSNGVILCTETRDLFDFMTVEDNLLLGSYRDRTDADERLEFVYEIFPKLERRTEQVAKTMSGGEQQMLALGRSLMGNPSVLMIDEPTLGLAPVIVDDIADAIEQITASGVTIVLAEQNVTFAQNHADRIYLLENGKKGWEGTPQAMKDNEYIRETYIGK